MIEVSWFLRHPAVLCGPSGCHINCHEDGSHMPKPRSQTRAECKIYEGTEPPLHSCPQLQDLNETVALVYNTRFPEQTKAKKGSTECSSCFWNQSSWTRMTAVTIMNINQNQRKFQQNTFLTWFSEGEERPSDRFFIWGQKQLKVTLEA